MLLTNEELLGVQVDSEFVCADCLTDKELANSEPRDVTTVADADECYAWCDRCKQYLK